MNPVTDTSTKELAHKAREEKANALKGLFDNCFVLPQKIYSEETLLPDTTYSENTRRKNTMDSESDSREDTIYSEGELRKNTACSDETLLVNTIYSDNTLREETIHSKMTSRKNATYGENTINGETYTGRVIQLSQLINFAALGVLAILIDVFPSGMGNLNISKMARTCGVARTTIIDQLRILEKKGLIELGPVKKEGRTIKIVCSENTTCNKNGICSENATYLSSSSLNKNYYKNNSIRNEHREYKTYSESETRSKDTIFNNTGMLTDDLRTKSYTGDFRNSMTNLKFMAEDLFYLACAARIDSIKISTQIFQIFHEQRLKYTRAYVAGLFLSLLFLTAKTGLEVLTRAVMEQDKLLT
jgi:hypothetical protein